MKTLYLVGGPMGVGKTTVCRMLQRLLPVCAFLDADWCWSLRLFVVNARTKAMALDNIGHVLNNFLNCPDVQNVVFCWVLHQREIWDAVESRLTPGNWRVVRCALVCDPAVLEERLRRDLRREDVLARAMDRLAKCRELDVPILDTTAMTPGRAAREILALGQVRLSPPVLRPYRPEDGPALAALFYQTVHTVNAAHYGPAQLDAWAPADRDLDVWNDSLLAHRTLVAWRDDEVVGFADMDDSGYLDRLYVHRDFQGLGLATALCDALEGESDAKAFTTHASLTARPFFEGRGYRVVREQQVRRRGVELTNFVMEKSVIREEEQP